MNRLQYIDKLRDYAGGLISSVDSRLDPEQIANDIDSYRIAAIQQFRMANGYIPDICYLTTYVDYTKMIPEDECEGLVRYNLKPRPAVIDGAYAFGYLGPGLPKPSYYQLTSSVKKTNAGGLISKMLTRISGGYYYNSQFSILEVIHPSVKPATLEIKMIPMNPVDIEEYNASVDQYPIDSSIWTFVLSTIKKEIMGGIKIPSDKTADGADGINKGNDK